MSRTITYLFDQSDIENLCRDLEEAREGKRAVTRQDVFEALGYLTTWAINSYEGVIISLNMRDRELLATYMEGDTCKYVIGAVWHGDHFGFHS